MAGKMLKSLSDSLSVLKEKLIVICCHCFAEFASYKTFRFHHPNCPMVRDCLSCAYLSGAACDICALVSAPPVSDESLDAHFIVSRISASITAAAENDGKLPGNFERIHKFGEKGLAMFQVKIFDEAAVDNCADAAAQLMRSLNELPSECPQHALQAICINGAGGPKKRPFSAHQDHTVQEYSRTVAKFMAFVNATTQETLESIVCNPLGSNESIVAKFLLHEAAHNVDFKNPDVFQHCGMQLQRMLRGIALQKFRNGMELAQACRLVNPTVLEYSFFPLFAMTKHAKNMVRAFLLMTDYLLTTMTGASQSMQGSYHGGNGGRSIMYKNTFTKNSGNNSS
jgi:hypothetical protein